VRVLCSENQHTGQPTPFRGIVVFVLESRETAYAKMLADRLKRSRGQQELEGNTIRHIKLSQSQSLPSVFPKVHRRLPPMMASFSR
jgi:hypothetical protein